MFLFIVSSSVCIIAWYMYMLWIVYLQTWFEPMLISDNPVSLDNLNSFEKPNTPQLSLIGRSRYTKFIYIFKKTE